MCASGTPRDATGGLDNPGSGDLASLRLRRWDDPRSRELAMISRRDDPGGLDDLGSPYNPGSWDFASLRLRSRDDPGSLNNRGSRGLASLLPCSRDKGNS